MRYIPIPNSWNVKRPVCFLSTRFLEAPSAPLTGGNQEALHTRHQTARGMRDLTSCKARERCRLSKNYEAVVNHRHGQEHAPSKYPLTGAALTNISWNLCTSTGNTLGNC